MITCRQCKVPKNKNAYASGGTKICRACANAVAKLRYKELRAGRDWGRAAKSYTHRCTRCSEGIKAEMVCTDARVTGEFHPRCLFQTLKQINPHYQKPKTA